MRYVLRTVIGMAMFAFCWVAFGSAIYQLLQVGTCASGGPYVVARECPDGLGWLVAAMVGSVFLIFIAAGVYIGRGKPPGAEKAPENAGVVVWFWTGLFWSLGAGALLGVWGPGANPGPGGELGGLIVGFMGVVMGAGGLAFVIWPWRERRRRQGRPSTPAVAPAASKRQRDRKPHVEERLEALDRLRRQGTLTDDEFETLKAKIVRDA